MARRNRAGGVVETYHTGRNFGIPASGKRIEIGGYRWYKVAGGKIVSQRGLLDLASLLQQIGANA